MSSRAIIRHLSGADVDLLRALNGLFAQVFDDPETYRAKPADDAYCRRILSRDDVIALVAIETVVVGGLVAYELHKLEQRRSEIYIYDLAVAPTHRRQGVATALIDRVRAIAAERGAWVVFVQADRGDDPAIALYEKLGAREEVLHFDLGVP